MASRKVEEALDHVKAAEKSLKTTFLKWRPDHESAADEYQKAATCFRNAKSFQQCKECLLKAADCHKQNRSCLDQAILVCKDLGDLSDVSVLAERACNMYQQHGSPDSGAAALDKAAKLLESQHPERALRLYQRAADVVNIEDSPRQAAEFMSKVARILVKLRMFDEAADALRREIGFHQQSEQVQAIGRLAVCLVLVQLGRGDYVAAEKDFKEWGNYCDAPEIQTLESLLIAYDEEDFDAVRVALNSPFIKHMDVEYARLARDLRLQESETSVNRAPEMKAKIASTDNADMEAAGDHPKDSNTGSSTVEKIPEDEYEGGLC
ncbi:Gamma-soluble NSF attachment protein [Gryllus bimaculatus]|nr:Gamma-soluble NSF attachment protein [Gryllus bimaculatus]